LIVRAIEWARRQPRSKSKQALKDRAARREREWDACVDEILDAGAPRIFSTKKPWML